MSDPVTRLNAALEGRYAIERELGEGGMATVYLAKDLKHNRSVALKVLKPELAAVVGAERFLAEITTTANLTHPHILPLHDSGEADGFLFYVMPHIEGESLRERIDREKQLGVDDAVAITHKVADALDYAHGKGVVHRDIKPGNILLSERGEPLIADFGIALAVAQAGGGRITETGLSLGTPHYMSPEQATGDRDVDPRSDVYALGCVLYEMLAGQPPFSAPTAQAVLVQILTSDAPSITSMRRTVPPQVGHALAQALEKLPADRFTSAAEFAAALADEGFTCKARARLVPTPATPEVAEDGRPSWHREGRSVAALLVGAAMTAVAAWGWLRPAPERGTLWTSLDLGEIVADPFGDVLVAPDGLAFATVGEVGGETALYARRADEAHFRLLPGTENARYPAFSPDGEWIVFRDMSESSLLRVPLDGGTPLTVLPSGVFNNPFQLNWGDDGTIVFHCAGRVCRIAETGGQPEFLLENANWAYFPLLLPGGSGVLLTDIRTMSIAVFDIEADTVRELIPEGLDAMYVDTGHIVYAHPNGGLFAVPFDLNGLEVTGPSVPVVDDVSLVAAGGQNALRAKYSISQNGTLVYGTGGSVAGQGGGGQLVVVDLEGNERTLTLTPRNFGEVAWSPDGRSVVYESNSDIYTYNVELGTTPRQLTFDGTNRRPVFSADGTRVAFASGRGGTDRFDLFVKTLGDDAPARSLITLAGDEIPTHWPSDALIVFEQAPNPSDLWMLDLSDPDSPRAEVYLPLEADLDDIVVSRDGALAAYGSNETGGDEVYIRSFPEPGERTPVSQGGGQYPFWSPDGNTVYYWSPTASGGSTFMAARIQRNPTPVVLSWDSLFTGSYDAPSSDLHPDGNRLVVPQLVPATTDAESGATEPLRFLVVTNWFEELRQRMGN